jgi:hypothetical protein
LGAAVGQSARAATVARRKRRAVKNWVEELSVCTCGRPFRYETSIPA